MRLLHAALAAIFLFVLAPVAHARSHELRDPMPVAVPAGISQEVLTESIKRVLAGRGWEVTGESEGTIDSTLFIREHVARIHITYDARQVAFTYVDSVNLEYQEKKGKRFIHGNYIGWIDYLISDLNLRLQFPVAPATTAAAPAVTSTAAAATAAPAPASDADPLLRAGRGVGIRDVTAISGPAVLEAPEKKSMALVILTGGERSKTVAPGSYVVTVGCVVGGFGMRFEKAMTVERGYDYLFDCEGYAAARAKLRVTRAPLTATPAATP